MFPACSRRRRGATGEGQERSARFAGRRRRKQQAFCAACTIGVEQQTGTECSRPCSMQGWGSQSGFMQQVV